MDRSRERLPSMYHSSGANVVPSTEQRRISRFTQFPWSGVSALIGAVCGIAVCVGILVASDGNLIYQWRYQPTVYLSVAYTITNLLIALAFREGVTVNWWRSALVEETTLGDLHRRYEYSQNIWSAIFSGRNMNLIAIAAILCAIVPINGPLLQRASTVGQIEHLQPVNMSIAAATALDTYTGFATGRNYAVSFMTPDFQRVAQAFADASPIPANGSGCDGSAKCSANLIALGLSVQCNRTNPPFTLDPMSSNGSLTFPSSSVFTTYFNWTLQRNPNQIYLSALFKNDTPCSGSVIQHECALTPATVMFPVMIDGNASTIQLDPNSTIWDDAVVNGTVSDPNETTIQGPVHLGGFWLALQDQLTSSMELSFSGAVGYSVSTDGAMSFPGRFANYSAASYDGAISASELCNITFSDPLPYMLNQARNLMFRKALADGNSSSTQHVVGREVITENVFRSHYVFLGIALGITLLAVAVISVTFHGYWQVARPATMNPLVLAKAFDSPLMKDVKADWKVTEMAQRVGKVPVRLRAVFQSTSPDVGSGGQYELSDSMAKESAIGLAYGQSKENLVPSHTGPDQRPASGSPYRWPLQ